MARYRVCYQSENMKQLKMHKSIELETMKICNNFVLALDNHIDYVWVEKFYSNSWHLVKYLKGGK